MSTETIDNVIELFEKLGVDYVCANIIFPSDESKRKLPEGFRQGYEGIDVANAGSRYARELGLVDQDSRCDGRDLEFQTLHHIGVGECYIKFKTLSRFKEVIELFQQHQQALPYFIIGSARGPSIEVRTQEKNSCNPTYSYDETQMELWGDRPKPSSTK